MEKRRERSKGRKKEVLSKIWHVLSIWTCCCVLACQGLETRACTSAVVSGRATADGRPLLWKHRDTDFLKNHVEHVRGERYDFIAIVNSEDFGRRHEAWIGVNSAGFALMNTQSYNLVDMSPGQERGEANGRAIYRALEICATVDDFRHFLDTIAKPSLIEANFGAIDAKGGAMMFEVGYHDYTAYDANNPQQAPQGYVIRTNFSVSGKLGPGAGVIRFQEAERIMKPCASRKEVCPSFIFEKLSRSFHHPLMDIDLRQPPFSNEEIGAGWFIDQDFIPRRSTSCSVVVQGVLPGEAAELTTMWTLLGYPPTGIAIPLWEKEAARLLPASVRKTPQTEETAPLSYRATMWRDSVFCLRIGMGSERYFCWRRLQHTQDEKGYMQRAIACERKIFGLALPMLEKWRNAGYIDPKALRDLYRQMERLCLETYEEDL